MDDELSKSPNDTRRKRTLSMYGSPSHCAWPDTPVYFGLAQVSDGYITLVYQNKLILVRTHVANLDVARGLPKTRSSPCNVAHARRESSLTKRAKVELDFTFCDFADDITRCSND